MMSNRTSSKFADTIGFTPMWFQLGVVNDDSILRYERDWQTSEDRHPEHYRYRAFREYLNQACPLSETQCTKLLELGQGDPDLSLGGAIMADILKLPECPQTILRVALSSDRSHLVKIAKRRLGID